MGFATYLVLSSDREWVVEVSMFVLFCVCLFSVDLHALTIWLSMLPADEVTTLLEATLRH